MNAVAETNSVSTRFTKHEVDGHHFVQQHTNLIDGRSLLWTRDTVGDEPLTFKEAQAAIEKLNKEKFGGFSDWRLPTVEELFLLGDRTRYNPAIDPEFFPDCPSSWFWTSTVDASSPSGCAWYVGEGMHGCYALAEETLVVAKEAMKL